VSWFNVNSALNYIQQFLTRWSTLIQNLNQNVRPSSIFECYSFISVVDAFDFHRYNVQRMGPSNQIIFKIAIKGDPNARTYFIVSRLNNDHEIRLNQGYRNIDDVYFNLDITISNGVGCLNKGVLEPQHIFTFCECKHYDTFYPSTCANFIGLARIVMPRNILWNPTTSHHLYPPPSLLVSGSASSDVHKMISVVSRKNYHIRFFDNISPRGRTMTTLTGWI
jgi:hypothetical protein